jgi:hypothetical protein
MTEVAHEFRVVVTDNHLNRTATSGCVARLVSLLDLFCDFEFTVKVSIIDFIEYLFSF